MARYEGVSASVIRRLPRYYRFLGELKAKGMERISSREFADIIGLTASQIRQDLNCFGGFGQQGYGYNIESLCAEIGRILNVDALRPTILVGAGNLGLALVNHMRFEARGFRLIGIFDSDPEKIGHTIRDWQIQDVARLEAFCQEHHPLAAILCIPKQVAVECADLLVQNGVKGFWNFTHQDLSIIYKDGIAVENVHLGDSLMTLSFNIAEVMDAE
ncbi:redox-sensing transcriptional repressor Rex [Ruminococcaceae bacterium OttesenSCG-928-L11]|nr:redox-sensing transcriptional repressor Rex [Ruminococcaceae bacterium OttesenSCG-928-L11]